MGFKFGYEFRDLMELKEQIGGLKKEIHILCCCKSSNNPISVLLSNHQSHFEPAAASKIQKDMTGLLHRTLIGPCGSSDMEVTMTLLKHFSALSL